jgi:HD superfamily phosphohydrolase
LVAEKKIFRDPIHNYIDVSGCALEIIEDPFFQRLRNIKQLSFTHYVYHGAEHSRFGHSLGVYHLANRLSDRLLLDEDREIREEFCLAALLHDVGHHPFSHSFEAVLKNAYKEIGVDFDHEYFTLKIINETTIGECIESSGLNKNHVIQLIQGSYTERANLQYLNQLISSEFDIDRLDYLLRDSYYCGIPYGKIDLERLLMSLEPDNDIITISEKGITSIEMYVLSRFYMYTQVYTHHTTRAFDLMLQNTLSREVLDEAEYHKINEDVNLLLNFDDHWLNMLLKELSLNEKYEHNILANNIIYRKPIKCVVEKSALMDRLSKYIDSEYTTISDLKYEKERLSEETGIKVDYIFFDEPWTNLPYGFQPYIPTEISPEKPLEVVEKKPIIIRTKKGLIDIAQEPNSIAHHISRFLAQVVRIYTLERYRKLLGITLGKIRPTIDHLIWKDKY